jgi:hypothetical protein
MLVALYIYGGGGGTLGTSTDAVTWTIRTPGTISTIRALTYGNGLYVYAGDGGVLGTAAEYSYNTATEFALPNPPLIFTTEVPNEANSYIKGD